MKLSNDQRSLLEEVATLGAQATWYNLGRRILGTLSSPNAFTPALRSLIDGGLLLEETNADGTPGRLTLTSLGRAAIAP